MGLPTRLRLEIYEHLVAGECDVDLTTMSIVHFYISREHASANDTSRVRHLSFICSITSSYSWIYICRQMLEEGNWEDLKDPYRLLRI